MAIKSVKATINGQEYTLTLNSGTGKYEATITAPATSSFNNNDDHYYPVEVKVTDMADNVTTKNDNAKTFNMYVNREPRFYVSVFYGGMYWFPKKTSEQIYLEMFKNGNNGPDASHNHYSTGYNMIKLASPEYEANPRKNVKRELPYMRYAEILLNFDGSRQRPVESRPTARCCEF